MLASLIFVFVESNIPTLDSMFLSYAYFVVVLVIRSMLAASFALPLIIPNIL